MDVFVSQIGSICLFSVGAQSEPVTGTHPRSEQLDKAFSVQTVPKTILSYFFSQARWLNHLTKSAKGKEVSAELFLLVLQSFSQCLSVLLQPPDFLFHGPWVQLQFLQSSFLLLVQSHQHQHIPVCWCW